MARAMSRVVIAGAGAVGRALAQRLADTHEVFLSEADLTATHEAEIAFAGAQTIVFLARASKRIARLPRADPKDIERLMADSVARAARLVGANHIVFFECGADDVRTPLLELSGVPLSILRGGGPDPVEALAELVRKGVPGPVVTAPWSGPDQEAKEPRYATCSVQRFKKLQGMTALSFARKYFEWLPGDVRFVKTMEREAVFTIHIAGVRALVLRYVAGRSNDDIAWFDIADGRMARRAEQSRFEFRHLLDGQTSIAALVGYEPSLPFWLYRFTQAVMHERVMRRFGQHLAP